MSAVPAVISGTQPRSRHRPSPLTGTPVIRERRPGGLVATYTPARTEPVLAGHFPGFPIFPGVCLVECAHQTALMGLPDSAVLVGMEQVRFLSPVFPGDQVRIDVDISADEGTSEWICAGRLTALREPASEPVDATVVRLRYRTGGANGRA